MQLNVISKRVLDFHRIMKLILNEEQNYLKETALSFVSEKTPVPFKG
ncbi:MAG: hypothetical protein Ct9H90mP6_11490 [Gammaproteobacteria bacterium]|nr:MAG: hypothetical protein Ct9H90mP6_11490 [Gammaproteobacteria bacterium]